LGIEAEGKVLGCYQERGGERQDGHRNALHGDIRFLRDNLTLRKGND
jgi:hypothetical protein